jgi:hypothetical protein
MYRQSFQAHRQHDHGDADDGGAIANDAVTKAMLNDDVRASASDQETGTAVDVFVAPGTQHRHASSAKAWAKFKRYNVQDVRITEQLFVLLSPWIKGPHRGLWTGDLATCHACGSTKLTHDGFVYSRTAVHPKVFCECGAWSRVLRSGEARPV